MYYLLIALGLGLISALPAFLSKRFGLGIIAVAVVSSLNALFLYANASGFAGPMFGAALLIALFWSSIVAWLSGVIETSTIKGDAPGIRLAVPGFLGIAMIGIMFFSSEMMNAPDYRNLIGTMETRVWTNDVQPKDPEHARLVLEENALYLARKQVGDLGTIGSQFEVREDSITIQAIKGELWYVIPLDFAGWRAWNNVGTSVGYIMVHAEDPNYKPIVKRLPKEEQFVYTPGAWFGNDLIRHLRLSGYLHVYLSGTHLEIDDEGHPHWITSVMEPTIGQGGKKVTGVLITNPVTGESQFSALGEVPHWVDRVIPQYLVERNLDYWGEYVHGWWAAFFSRLDLTEPESSRLVYSSEHDPVFVTGITSRDGNDDSLIGTVYTHTRTGKSVFYEVKGGATDAAVLAAVEKFPGIQLNHLHGGGPQLYNLYGTMASIVPLVNDNHAFSGVAIVNINDVQQIAHGNNLAEALRHYQRTLGRTGDLASLSSERKLATIEATVLRVKQDLTQTGSSYYIVLEGVKRAFVGGSSEFPFLPLVQMGDKVKIEYYASGESIVPIHSIYNLSLVLEKTAAEEAVAARKEATRDANEAKPVKRDLTERLKTMTPEELKALDQMTEKKKDDKK